ncbi:hypothetical protein UFOVP58_11 [uncultured Caudovirales phage]|uniref:Uncharacterized protein n=1 Tax=uncultured Caudovirales phage TaxID=2100421 RepID=A0A6J5KQ90_9CAUD|nr:hypothetical protein UFOVP58_11 [uncultured Caudovirales phage]
MDSTKRQKLENFILYLSEFGLADSTIIRMASGRLSVKPREVKEILNSVIRSSDEAQTDRTQT